MERFSAQPHMTEVGLSWGNESGEIKRDVREAEKKCNEQMNGWVQGLKGIDVEVKLKAEKHEVGTGDEWLVITWRGTCDCVSTGDGGAPWRSGALRLMSSQLHWISRGLSQLLLLEIEPVL